MGVAFSDMFMYCRTRGDADSLALLDSRHYHGLFKGLAPWARTDAKELTAKC